MRLEFQLKRELPKLAWIAQVNGEEVYVTHGEYVESNPVFFVEGAWNGDYLSGKFSEADWFCGTGGRIVQDRILFSTPSHVLSGIFTAKRNGGVFASNSLPFLLAELNEKIDPQYANYEVDFNTIIDGLNCYKREIHLLESDEYNDKSNIVEIHYYCNVMVKSNGEIFEELKEKVDPFRDFKDYYTRLVSVMTDFSKNASHEIRNHKFKFVTTISKGYDSLCCAVIAKKVGCNIACTFAEEGHYATDNGTNLATQIGYTNIIERSENEMFKRNDYPEAYYLASGELMGASFAVFDDVFEGNCVLTGERGDSVWAKEKGIVNNSFRFDFNSHISFCEARLWNGFVHIPLPLFGATSWTSIQRISQSRQMAAWSIGGDYDRPIPRRIIEEAGITRESFGMVKNGASFNYRYYPYGRVLKRMSNHSAESFAVYVQKYKRIKISDRITYYWKKRSIYLSRIGINIRKISEYEDNHMANPNEVRYLFPWACTYVRDRYKQIIEG